ncbi:MAG: hypothetical protein FWG77_02055 [Treponema sp.]|nr:hypothetical protein [Treponema sp.]
MKIKTNLLLFFTLFSLIIVLSGCRSTPGQPGGGMYPPQIERAWSIYSQENVFIGIGNADFGPDNLAMSRRMAASRARMAVASEMSQFGQSMVLDYVGANELTGDSLNYAIALDEALSEFDVSGARMIAEDRDSTGMIWVMVVLDEASITRAIDMAATAARLAVPAMAAMNARDLMYEAFDRRQGYRPTPISIGGEE